MNNYTRDIKNEDGTEETIIISSNDNRILNMNQTYKLANHSQKKESKLAKKFKNSILGADIGVNSGGFTNVAILATVIAIGTLFVMYLFWRL